MDWGHSGVGPGGLFGHPDPEDGALVKRDLQGVYLVQAGGILSREVCGHEEAV